MERGGNKDERFLDNIIGEDRKKSLFAHFVIATKKNSGWQSNIYIYIHILKYVYTLYILLYNIYTFLNTYITHHHTVLIT